MKVHFHLLDVFADAPFRGNQLCVVSETPAGLDAAMMQTLAREINFSETTFVTARDATGYTLRIFTAASELPFAGHPTLGTAFALASRGIAPRARSRCAWTSPLAWPRCANLLRCSARR